MYCLLISSLPTSIIIRLIYDYANKILPPSFDKTWIRNSETRATICEMAMISKIPVFTLAPTHI